MYKTVFLVQKNVKAVSKRSGINSVSGSNSVSYWVLVCIQVIKTIKY